MYRTHALAALLVCLGCNLTCAWAGDDEDPLRPIPPVAQVKIADFRNYGMGGNFALSPDGKTLASAMHNSLVLYDLGALTHASQGRNLPLRNMYFMDSAIAFSADGKLLAGVGAQHQEDQTLHFFDIQTGKEARQIDNDQHFFGLAFSADGKVLALGGQQQVELWDAVSGDEIRILPGEQNAFYRALAFSPDGKMLATTGGGPAVQLWEIASGKERTHFSVQVEVPEDRRFYGPGGQSLIAGLAFSRDGKLLAAGCADGAVRLWHIGTGVEQPPLSGHLGAVGALAFTADGKRLVSFDQDGLKLAWNVRSLQRPTLDKLPALSDAAFEEAWTDLADADAFHVYRATRYLASDPARTLAWMNQHLRAVRPGDPKRLGKLVADLQSPKASERRKAMAALRKEGEAGLGALAQATDQGPGNANPAVRVRMAAFRGGAFPGGGAAGPLLRKLEEECASPERSRSLRAVRVLEQIDNDQSRELLQKLSRGAAGAMLTVNANAALERMKSAKTSEKAATANTRKPASASQEDALWVGLASPDAAAAFTTMRALWGNPRLGLALLQERLRPTADSDLSRIAQLIASLDDARFPEREAATKALATLGKLAGPALRQALGGTPSPEARRRIEQLLERCDQAEPSAETLRSLRAIEVLEQINSPESRQVLENLTKGAPSAEATREARTAIQRMALRK